MVRGNCGMRRRIKDIICGLRLEELAGRLRAAAYAGFDLCGYFIFGLLRLCFVIPRPRPYDRAAVKKILLIRLDRIGDVIVSTPAIRAVRGEFPSADIHLLVNKYTRDLVINNPNINKVLVYGTGLLGRDYDMGIALHAGTLQNYLAFKSGAGVRLGYSGWGGGFFLTKRCIDDCAERIRHEAQSALEVVSLICDVKSDMRLEVSITEHGEQFADDFFKKNGLLSGGMAVAVHPGARQAYIRWKRERFAAVADRLMREIGARVVLIGGAEEEGLVNDTAALMSQRPALAAGLGLTQLVSVINRCGLFIGNSTGPMHIAAALNVPTVAIFGSEHPLDSYKTWGPIGGRHRVVSKDAGCKVCNPTKCRTFDCMDKISEDDVFRAAMEVLGK